MARLKISPGLVAWSCTAMMLAMTLPPHESQAIEEAEVTEYLTNNIVKSLKALGHLARKDGAELWSRRGGRNDYELPRRVVSALYGDVTKPEVLPSMLLDAVLLQSEAGEASNAMWRNLKKMQRGWRWPEEQLPSGPRQSLALTHQNRIGGSLADWTSTAQTRGDALESLELTGVLGATKIVIQKRLNEGAGAVTTSVRLEGPRGRVWVDKHGKVRTRTVKGTAHHPRQPPERRPRTAVQRFQR